MPSNKTQTNPGYHLAEIDKGKIGEVSKILEEAQEAADATQQGCKVMVLVELADMIGATKLYLKKHHPGITLEDLEVFADITSRALERERHLASLGVTSDLIQWIMLPEKKSIIHAATYAAEAHHGATRTNSEEAYINHPIRVAQLVERCGLNEDCIIAALLHDTVEDTHVTLENIKAKFGNRVRKLVEDLTTPTTTGNRAARQTAETKRLATIDPEAKTIKCCDIADNARDIADKAPKFAPVWLKEKQQHLASLQDASETDPSNHHRNGDTQ